MARDGLNPEPRRAGYRGKRLLDLAIAIPALVLLGPLMVLVAVLISYRMGRPVLFRQVRPGLRGQPFVMLKFRTMNDMRDASGSHLPDAERLTALGRFLRSTSLDELPELLNVVRGEMSIVGPRPLLTQYLARYTPEQMRRHDATPGITGWSQIHGRNTLDWDRKFALDVWYVDHQSLRVDVGIIARTAWKVIRREGISEPGMATMTEFLGNQTKRSAS